MNKKQVFSRSKYENVAEMLTANLELMTKSEKRISRALLANYPVLGLMTAAEFADTVGVSGTTILRFIERLGFSKYSEFQKSLHKELEARSKTPLSKASLGNISGETGKYIYSYEKAIQQNIHETLRHIPRAEFNAVVAELVNVKHSVYILGGRFTNALAYYLSAHLRIIRPNVHFIGDQSLNWQDYIINMRKKDVVIIFDLRRYQDQLISFANRASERGVDIILFTDQWLSPIASKSTHVLSSRVAVPSNWDSNSAVLTLVEILIAIVTQRLGSTVEERLKLSESIRNS